MLTCNAEACDEDGCAPRTSGVTHNKFFTTANDLGTNGAIKLSGKGSFKIKVSNVGSFVLDSRLMPLKLLDATATTFQFCTLALSVIFMITSKCE